MKKVSYASCALALLSLLSAFSYSTQAAPANTIYLRTDCTDGGAAVPGCYTNLDALSSAIATLNPSATNPLVIEAGPGNFSGVFKCSNVSHVSLRGAGRSNTTMGSLSGMNNFQLINCDSLNVSSLRVQGTYYIIQWKGKGTTTWTDVDVSGAGIGWYDDNTAGSPACSAADTKHYWYSSKFQVHPFLTQSASYVANCGSHWFYGSELVSTSETLDGVAWPASGTNDVLRANGESDVHVYGSVMRLLAPINTTGTPYTDRFKLVTSTGGAKVHIHGTGMDAESALPLDVTVLSASTGGEIHANESSYSLKTESGTITRVRNVDGTGHIHAPYAWEAHAEAPNIFSVNGFDTAVVTNTADGYPHTVVYSTACASRWYDTTGRICR